MRPLSLAMALAVAGCSNGFAQQAASNPALISPRLDLSLGYNHINANAPPGTCDCFGLNGAYAAGTYHYTRHFGATVEATGGHKGDISTLGQDLTLITVMGGPRVTFPFHRLVPYGQALVGFGHGSDSYFPSANSFKTSASSFAVSGGGGLDVTLNRRFAIRAINVEYLRTAFPNGTTNFQNQLMLGAGIVIKFGGHAEEVAAAPPPPARPSEISFSCSTSSANVEEGQTIDIVGHAFTEPDHFQLNYTWDSPDGTVQGDGRRVGLNTTGFAAGEHTVRGHVSMANDPATKADCSATFRVVPRAVVVAARAPVEPTPAEVAKNEEVFHENVQDALFDYDSSDLRPDAQQATDRAAAYLKAHPSISVLIAGYADDRGSAEYNIALSARRADSAKQALIAAGVSRERLQIISYGKEMQVCTQQDEKCWQQNRRAAFNMHP